MKKVLLFFSCLLLLLLTSCYDAPELYNYTLTIVDNGALFGNDYQHIISITSDGSFNEIYYTIDDTTPTSNSLKYIPSQYKGSDSEIYTGILVNEGSTIKAIAYNKTEHSFVAEKEVKFDYQIGDKGPAGGYIFYDCDADNNSGNRDGLISAECGWRYLEAAPEDLSDTYVFGYYRDSNSGADKEVGTNTAIGTGKANTEALVAAMGRTAYTSYSGGDKSVYAAVACADFVVTSNGIDYDDWFLPSKEELDLMYDRLYKKGIGSFSKQNYWTSSEFGSLYVTYQNFSYGSQDRNERSRFQSVRPIRSFGSCSHVWDSGVTTVPSTCGTDGLVTYTCTNCGQTKVETILATGNHTYSSYKCTVCGQFGKGPAGGYVFYDCDADNTEDDPDGADNLKSDVCGWRYLEAAPEDLDDTYPFGYYRSNAYGSNTKIGTEYGVGKGKENTDLLVASMGNSAFISSSGTAKGDYAAKACVNYSCTNNGIVYDDWFLPSRGELNRMYDNLYQKGLGSFEKTDYLSSTEYSQGSVYCNFVTASCEKGTYNRVRPIRAFGGCVNNSDHSWNNGTVTAVATCTTPGTETYTCLNCNKTRTEVVLLAHNYVNFKCSDCGIWGRGPAGGYVFYDCDADNDSGNADGLRSYECGWRFLETAPSDLNKEYSFGYYRKDSTSSNEYLKTSSAIGMGKTNTDTLLKKMGIYSYMEDSGTLKGRYAAKACSDYSVTVNGVLYNDWFLPSYEELKLMYTNLHEKGLDSFYDGGSYWSSTEYSEFRAEYKKFYEEDSLTSRYSSSTSSYVASKSSENRIRPIRAFDNCTNNASHTWNSGVETTPATCNSAGVMTYTCTVCGKTRTEIIVATENHSWNSGVETTPAKCTTEGVMTYTCEVCGQTRTDSISPTGIHSWDSGVSSIPVTCTTNGEMVYTCENCGQTRTEVVVAAGSHSWNSGAETLAPTCINTGIKTYTCTACGQTKTETIKATGHSYVDYKCTVCSVGTAGGLIFYDCDADNDAGNADGLISSECGWRYLEAATEDLNDKYAYIFGYHRSSPNGSNLVVGTETAIGTGKANTEALVNAMGTTAYAYKKSDATYKDEYAAKACADYSITVDGVVYDDWFLPSKNELNLMYENLKKMGLGTWTNGYYRSSSEIDEYNSWCQYFPDGSKDSIERKTAIDVRPVRSF